MGEGEHLLVHSLLAARQHDDDLSFYAMCVEKALGHEMNSTLSPGAQAERANMVALRCLEFYQELKETQSPQEATDA
jgi:hypothetical protein